MAFINRKTELDQLNTLWEQKTSQLVVLYGKRRVGKTELIKQFLNKHTGFYYLADKRTQKEQLLELGRVAGNYFNDTILAKHGFESWIEAFTYLKKKSKNKQFVIAIDEYPYLVETQNDTSSIFQKAWDEYLKESNIFLILCGSSIAMMESEILAYKAPLYGRTTGRMRIDPMTAASSMKFYPQLSFDQFLKYYSITGGMPAYLQSFSQFENIDKGLEDLCFNKNGLYHDEVTFMLKQELRTPNIYFAILKAIAWGKTKVTEIANDAGLEVQLVNKYLTTLEQLQFIKREIPVTEDKPHKSKRGIYVLSENFTRFWFQYIYAFSSDLELGNSQQTKKKFKEFGNILEAIAYEEIARWNIWNLQKDIGMIERVGRYWDKDIEIDGIGLNQTEKKIIFMEAKWSDKKIGKTVLNKLRMKAKNVSWNSAKRLEFFIIYNKSGFEDDLLQEAQIDTNIILIHQLNKI